MILKSEKSDAGIYHVFFSVFLNFSYFHVDQKHNYQLEWPYIISFTS